MMSLYVRGKYAILPNLPRPPIRVIVDHAHVSIIDCIADLFGHGMQLDGITTTQVTGGVTGLVNLMLLSTSKKMLMGFTMMTLTVLSFFLVMNKVMGSSHQYLQKILEGSAG